jgi:hypothetical protein
MSGFRKCFKNSARDLAVSKAEKSGIRKLEAELSELQVVKYEQKLVIANREYEKKLVPISLEQASALGFIVADINTARLKHIAYCQHPISFYHKTAASLITREFLMEENDGFLARARTTPLPEKRLLYSKLPPSLRTIVEAIRMLVKAPQAYLHGSIFYKDNPQDTDWQIDTGLDNLPSGFVTKEKIAELFPALDQEAIEVREERRSGVIMAISIKIKDLRDAVMLDIVLCPAFYADTPNCTSYYDSVRMGDDEKFYFKKKYQDKFRELWRAEPGDADAYPFHAASYHQVIVKEAPGFHLRSAYQLLDNNKALTAEGRAAIKDGIKSCLDDKLLQPRVTKDGILAGAEQFIEKHKLTEKDAAEFRTTIREGLAAERILPSSAVGSAGIAGSRGFEIF